uniref:B30.2/SPRY domain-containing protein n=1 Tax=Amphimedon queenslandica TaxID=400682 RepID=A0A1X7VTP3_AMPQE
MGNEQSKEKEKHVFSTHELVFNQLNEAPVYCFDQNVSSEGLAFSHSNLKVRFPSRQDQFQVAYLNAYLQLGHVDQTLSVRARLEDSVGSIAVIGFGESNTRSHSDLYLFDVTQRKVYLCGDEVPNVRLPVCGDGDIIQFQVDIGRGRLSYQIINSASSKQESATAGDRSLVTFKFDSADLPHSVRPLFGMRSTSVTEPSFHVLEVSRELSLTDKALFDKESIYGPVTLSNDCLNISRQDIKSNCCALIDKVLREGTHRWKIRILKDVGASTCLGIAKHPFYVPNMYGMSSQHMYLHSQLMVWRSYGGSLYSSGSKLSHELRPLDYDDKPVTVEFLLDLTAGTLEIIREGVSLGIAFKGIKPPVQPVVVFYAGCEKEVQLVSFHSNAPSGNNDDPILLKQSGSKRSSDRVTKKHKKRISYAFDRSMTYGSLLISPDGMTVERRQSHIGNAYCLINQTCSTGVYNWSFKINEDQGASICLGITTEPVEVTNDAIYESKSMYLYRSYMGKLYYNGRELRKEFEEFWMPGTIVELILDLVNGVLQILVNGINQGVCFGNLEAKAYRPIVCFYAAMPKSITLLKFEHFPSEPKAMFVPNNLNQGMPFQSNGLSEDIEKGIQRTDRCMVCSAIDGNVVILPCKHAVYCAAHAVVGEYCIVCERRIESIVNVF